MVMPVVDTGLTRPQTLGLSQDLVQRPYDAGDAPAVTDLMNLIARHGGGKPGFTARELDGLVSTLVHSPATDSTVLTDAAGTVVAAGFTTTPPAGGYRVHVTGGVHPDWRGRGIGRLLLGRHLDRAVDLHRERAPQAEWEAHVRTPVGDTDALRLYQRLGLNPVRYWFEMAAPAAAGRAVVAPNGLRLTPYQPEYQAAVHAAHMEAFVDNWGYQHRELTSWASITVSAAGFLPGLSLLAHDGGELAGYLLTYQHAEAGRVYVGQVGVRKPWRRCGLASALLAAALRAAQADGRAVVGLSVDADSPTGAVGVYARAGFAVEYSAVTYSMRIGS